MLAITATPQTWGKQFGLLRCCCKGRDCYSCSSNQHRVTKNAGGTNSGDKVHHLTGFVRPLMAAPNQREYQWC